jgi:hypothetical protein
MPITIKVNGTVNSLVHKMSNGISIATIPDVCKTPSPAGPVPIPYPNIAQAITLSSGTTSVKGDKMMAGNKGSKFALSNGDNAGVAGGVKSSTFMKEATWILYSFDVKLQKKNACRFTDKMFHNSENAANLSGEVNPPVTDGSASGDDDDCSDAAGGTQGQKYKGGKHGKMAPGGKSRTPPGESHHMPANSASPLKTNHGPTIQMDKVDHMLTGSWGSSAAAKAYRAAQSLLINTGGKAGFRAAMLMDIRDIRKKFGTKYDDAIRQMLDYANCMGYI